MTLTMIIIIILKCTEYIRTLINRSIYWNRFRVAWVLEHITLLSGRVRYIVWILASIGDRYGRVYLPLLLAMLVAFAVGLHNRRRDDDRWAVINFDSIFIAMETAAAAAVLEVYSFPIWKFETYSDILYDGIRGGSKGARKGAAPPVKILPHPVDLPMEFMIKHNLSLVRGGSLWQYRSVPPSCNYGHPTAPPNVSPRTATATESPRLLLRLV